MIDAGDCLHDTPPPLGLATIEWRRVQRATYLMHQRFTYEYPDPIRDLRHQLMVVPPESFGDQRRSVYSLEVSQPGETITRTDGFANTVIDVRIPRVEAQVVFEAWVNLKRHGQPAPRAVPVAWLHDSRFLEPTTRTAPDARIAAAAASIGAGGAQGLELAEQITKWVHQRMDYAPGTTGIRTTAATALELGSGVCQDFSHLAIALCRVLGLPALYVSGHLLGEGPTHSWIEVVLPASDGSATAEGWALDPTHGRRAGLTYLTVAVGRDYGDVAPTSGSYRAGRGGVLSSMKEVQVIDVAYRD